MFVFIAYVLISVAIMVFAEKQHNHEGKGDHEGLKIVKGCIIVLPVVIGVLFKLAPFILASIAIVLVKCLYTHYTKPAK